jgi:uncharacterized integral membrane protein
MWVVRLLLTIFIIIIIIALAVYNAGEKTTFRLLGHTYEQIPVIVVACWSFVIGMIAAFILGLTYHSRLYKQLADQKRETKKLLSELTSLRNVALEEAEE